MSDLMNAHLNAMKEINKNIDKTLAQKNSPVDVEELWRFVDDTVIALGEYIPVIGDEDMLNVFCDLHKEGKKLIDRGDDEVSPDRHQRLVGAVKWAMQHRNCPDPIGWDYICECLNHALGEDK